MKFGLYGLHKGENTEPEAFARRARAAEEAGFESIWVGDHIALPPDAPDDAYDPRLEAIVALAHLAAVTERVRLGLGVIILPQRQPVLLAKQLTSIDRLSGGRLTVGFGVGYLEAELGALGVDAGRARRAHRRVAGGHPHAVGRARAGVRGALRLVLERDPAAASGAGPAPADRDRRRLAGGGAAGARGRWLVRLGAHAGADRRDARAARRRTSRSRSRPGRRGRSTRTSCARYEEAGVARLVLQPPDTTGAAMDELIGSI